MYDDILKRLGIEGENESDKFRSLIEFLFDYVEINPQVTSEPKIEKDFGDNSRLDVLDLVIQSLKEHEANLDKIAIKLEKSATPNILNLDTNLSNPIQQRLLKD